MRWLIALGLIVTHVALVACVGYLPEPLHPALAATIYAPLWFFSSLGLPVFGRAESGGWSGPSVFGWVVLLVFWSTVWTLLVLGIAKARR